MTVQVMTVQLMTVQRKRTWRNSATFSRGPGESAGDGRGSRRGRTKQSENRDERGQIRRDDAPPLHRWRTDWRRRIDRCEPPSVREWCCVRRSDVSPSQSRRRVPYSQRPGQGSTEYDRPAVAGRAGWCNHRTMPCRSPRDRQTRRRPANRAPATRDDLRAVTTRRGDPVDSDTAQDHVFHVRRRPGFDPQAGDPSDIERARVRREGNPRRLIVRTPLPRAAQWRHRGCGWTSGRSTSSSAWP